MNCMSLSSFSSSSPPRKRPRRSSPPPSDEAQPCAILYVSDDVLSAVLFPFMALSEHFRLARTCRHMLSMSGCSHPPSQLRVRPCAWNKHVHVPVGVSDDSLAKMCQFVRAPSMSLKDCVHVTDVGCAHLRQLPLCTLSLRGCERLTDVSLTYLQQLPLRTLNLERCILITDGGLAHLQNVPPTQDCFILRIFPLKY